MAAVAEAAAALPSTSKAESYTGNMEGQMQVWFDLGVVLTSAGILR